MENAYFDNAMCGFFFLHQNKLIFQSHVPCALWSASRFLTVCVGQTRITACARQAHTCMRTRTRFLEYESACLSQPRGDVLLTLRPRQPPAPWFSHVTFRALPSTAPPPHGRRPPSVRHAHAGSYFWAFCSVAGNLPPPKSGQVDQR